MLLQTENIMDMDKDDGNNENESQYYQDPVTGAHFRYADVYMKLLRLQKEREASETFAVPLETVKMDPFVTATLGAKVDFGPASFVNHTLQANSNGKSTLKKVPNEKRKAGSNVKNRNSIGAVHAKHVQSRKMLEPYMASPACLSADRSGYKVLMDKKAVTKYGAIYVGSPKGEKMMLGSDKNLYTCTNGVEKPIINSGRESVCAKGERPNRRIIACLQSPGSRPIIKRVTSHVKTQRNDKEEVKERGGPAETQEEECSSKQNQVGEKCVITKELITKNKGHRKTTSMKSPNNKDCTFKQPVMLKIRPVQSKKRIPAASIYRNLIAT